MSNLVSNFVSSLVHESSKEIHHWRILIHFEPSIAPRSRGEASREGWGFPFLSMVGLHLLIIRFPGFFAPAGRSRLGEAR